MSDKNSGSDTSVGLIDIASRVPGLLSDVPVIVRGVLTGLLPQSNSKASIGKVFQDRAGRYGDRVFLRFGDQKLTYREANAAANRYAAVLAARGVGRGDVVGIMLRNSPNAVLMMLATVKCGAIAGMLNYHQRGEVLAHSLGLLNAKVLVAEADLIDPVDECGGLDIAPTTIEEMIQLPGVARKTANVVLGSWYGIPSGVVVDTHVLRISRRLELTQATEPVKVEQDLQKVIPQDRWIQFSHELIHHGRQVCIARKPKCVDCSLEKLCNSADKTWSSH